jgi:hypothetical protein
MVVGGIQWLSLDAWKKIVNKSKHEPHLMILREQKLHKFSKLPMLIYLEADPPLKVANHAPASSLLKAKLENPQE